MGLGQRRSRAFRRRGDRGHQKLVLICRRSEDGLRLTSAQSRLDAVARELDGKDYLLGRFTAADVLLTTVLRMLRDTDLVTSRPVLVEYQRRCEQRPAFKKALAAQIACFEKNAPTAA